MDGAHCESMLTTTEANFQLRSLGIERKLRFRMLDVRRLRVLRELAARGTIAATADALGYTAPAVSQQLAALEREAGVALLERNGRTRRLTPAGEELVQRTEGILRELEAAEAALERTTTHVAGVLRCAGFASAHRILLPRAIAALSQRHPDLRVTTRDMEPEDSLPALKLGELDLAIAQEYAFSPTPADPAIERTDLLEDRLRVALPEDHPLAAEPEVDMRALEHEPWIAGREGSFCHLVVIHSTRAAGYEPRLDPHHQRLRRLLRARRQPAPASGSCPSWRDRRRPAWSRGRSRARRRAGGSTPRCAPAAAPARRSRRCSTRSPSAEHRVQQPREALVELVAAQPVHERGALGPLLDHAALAQHAEVVRARRLRHRQIERAAAALALVGQRAHDLEPHRIGERVQDAGQLERVGGRMVQSTRHESHCTTLIGHLVRWSSYFRMKGPRMTPPSSPPKRPPFRRVVVFTGRAS